MERSYPDPKEPKDGNLSISCSRQSKRSKTFPMRKRSKSVRRPYGPSLMPFGRELRKPLRWLPQMRNSPRHSDIPKTRRNIWKHFWKTGACRSLTIYVKQISSRSPQQGGHGSLLTLQRGQRQTQSFILWWKVPVPTN